jgi:hypothetical protein
MAMTNVVEVSAEASPEPASAGDEIQRWARNRAEMLQGLYIHMLVFGVINLGLIVTNWLTREPDGAWWSVWPLLIWGVGLLVHVVVVVAPVFSPEWVDRRAEELAAKRGG